MGCQQSTPVEKLEDDDGLLNNGDYYSKDPVSSMAKEAPSDSAPKKKKKEKKKSEKSLSKKKEKAPQSQSKAPTEQQEEPSEKPTTANPYNRAKDRTDAIPESKTIECSGIKMTYAYVSQRGFYPDDPFKANQDSYCVHQNLVNGKNDALFAVFDGHGKDGDGCAIYARKTLPPQITHLIEHTKKKEKIVELTKEQMHKALLKAHVETNKKLRNEPSVDDSLSGTTAISVYFHGRRNRITVSNVGDSRCVVGVKNPLTSSQKGSNLKAYPLSRDQTPYRKDERIRIRATGARVLSLDQLEGLEPILEEGMSEAEEVELGEEIDEGGDPPRVWHPEGDYPGTAFTRSIGDAMAEDLGVFAEPEMLTREITPDDKILVVASDGVYEFLTNQSVIDICAKFDDPLEACRAVVAEAYELWLQYELRTDDITIICIFIDSVKEDPADRRASLGGVAVGAEPGKTGKTDQNDDLVDNKPVSSEGLRPVRKNVSKEKSKAIMKLKEQGKSLSVQDVNDEIIDLSSLATKKTTEEKKGIADAIKASIMFRNVTDEQRELIYDCMESINVKAGTWIIRQGTVGDRFYIVDEGRFEVRIVPDGEEDLNGQGGHIVHCYEGSRKKNMHPTFGELALMHSAPRSASIVAQSDGHLWALHKAAFRQILLQAHDHRKELKDVLAIIPYFSNLDSDGINKLSAIMDEITVGRGDTINEQGEHGDKLYVIKSGSCFSTYNPKGGQPVRKNLKVGDYFGDEIFRGDGTYGSTIMALHTTTCWSVDKNLLKQTMGPLLKGGS
jgi:serine/threonine protein phosphatase PrpC/CRP-like cAMP-binding protein